MKPLKYIFSIIILSGLIVGAYVYFSGIGRTKNASIVSPIGDEPAKKSVFSLEQAPSSTLHGTIASMSGDIRFQGRMATEAAVIMTPVDIQQGEKLVLGDKSSLSLVFQGACTVGLSANTVMEIVQTLPATIVFSQTGGTGTYEKTGEYAISVRTKNTVVENNGTIIISFSEEKPVTEFTQKSGTSTVAFNDASFVSHEVTVSAGHIYTFNYDTRKGVLK